ncbi:LEA type 2 family protein [Pseudomonas matsuisoli]|uniref:Water stress and hypersensitive response domain-containing protein n=1 Tax=Pseudomonas matsuisoli TaxID=1515666 RepID=A0A917PYJ5_9PSED|nr:LEA type 2 family protein [Pseudomonas matsuisoli]GGK01251.1 hypothetical protein GCM10009304_28780 [Pseudomonas matsuisoli]
MNITIAYTRLGWLVFTALLLFLSGCNSLTGREPLTVNLVDVAPLAGGNLEVRFALELRFQNPNADALNYDGVSLALDLNGKQLARGVSDAKGKVPGFGETLVTVPMSISAFSALQQAWAASRNVTSEALPYRLSGRLGGGFLGNRRFVDEGTLTWPDFENRR